MAEKKSGIDQKLIRDLANILNDTDLTEIEVEQDDLRIRVSRNGTPVMMPQQMQGYAYQAPAAPAAAPAAVAAPAAPAAPSSTAVQTPMRSDIDRAEHRSSMRSPQRVRSSS